MLKIHINVE